MPTGPYNFRDHSRRAGLNIDDSVQECALPAAPQGAEPHDLEIGSLWWNSTTNSLRIRKPTGDEDVGSGVAADFEAGGVQELNVTDLSGRLADPQDADTLITSTPTALPIGVIADGQFLKRVGGNIVGAAASIAFDPAVDIVPLHRWRASNVLETGGLVDALVDTGTVPKNFVQTGAARAPRVADGSNFYLALDGAADFYQAGVAADWTFLSNGSPFTVVIVYHRTTAPGTYELLLDNVDSSGANAGFFISLSNGAGNRHIRHVIARTTPGVWALAVNSLVVDTAKTCAVTRFTGANAEPIPGSGVILYPDMILRRRGALTSQAVVANSFSANNPPFPLGLCGPGSGTAANRCPARIYEIVIDNKAWSDRQVLGFEDYARTTYGLAI